MLTDVPGFAVGHWSDPIGLTGCTVVIAPSGTTGSGEVRGGAPATREFELLDPIRRVASVDAVVLTGGSAFGLAAADGIMTWLEAQGRGVETVGGRVPIVVGMGLYDLGVGDPRARPGANQGRAAAIAATTGPHAVGRIGAGVGATLAKWYGGERSEPGGIGSATLRSGDLIVSALIVANAVGAIDDGTNDTDIGPPQWESPAMETFANTTIGVIATNAIVDKKGCLLLAQSGHDGLARALLPAHTEADGDALVALATGQVEAVLFHLRLLAQQVVTRAVRSLR